MWRIFASSHLSWFSQPSAILDLGNHADFWQQTSIYSPVLCCVVLSSKSIGGPLTKLMNKCINSSTWPNLWKLSNVSPIHKKDSSKTNKNYRPVSILTCISKVFEKIQYDQIFTFVSDLLSDNLSGFLKVTRTPQRCSKWLKTSGHL